MANDKDRKVVYKAKRGHKLKDEQYKRLIELAELGLKYKAPPKPTIPASKKAKALDDLKILNGLPPHDGGGNICRGDGYFANSLVRKYGMSIEQLMEATGYNDIAHEWNQQRQKFIGK